MTFYAAEWGGEIFAEESASLEIVQRFMDGLFAECCSGFSMRNGETKTDSCEILKYSDNDETGERTILERIPYELEFEYYHGDLAEHGTYQI